MFDEQFHVIYGKRKRKLKDKSSSSLKTYKHIQSIGPSDYLIDREFTKLFIYLTLHVTSYIITIEFLMNNKILATVLFNNLLQSIHAFHFKMWASEFFFYKKR